MTFIEISTLFAYTKTSTSVIQLSTQHNKVHLQIFSSHSVATQMTCFPTFLPENNPAREDGAASKPWHVFDVHDLSPLVERGDVVREARQQIRVVALHEPLEPDALDHNVIQVAHRLVVRQAVHRDYPTACDPAEHPHVAQRCIEHVPAHVVEVYVNAFWEMPVNKFIYMSKIGCALILFVTSDEIQNLTFSMPRLTRALPCS